MVGWLVGWLLCLPRPSASPMVAMTFDNLLPTTRRATDIESTIILSSRMKTEATKHKESTTFSEESVSIPVYHWWSRDLYRRLCCCYWIRRLPDAVSTAVRLHADNAVIKDRKQCDADAPKRRLGQRTQGDYRSIPTTSSLQYLDHVSRQSTVGDVDPRGITRRPSSRRDTTWHDAAGPGPGRHHFANRIIDEMKLKMMNSSVAVLYAASVVHCMGWSSDEGQPGRVGLFSSHWYVVAASIPSSFDVSM